MKHFLQNKAGEEDSGAGAPDVSKLVQDGFKTLQAELGNLNKRIEAQEKKASAPAPKVRPPVVEDPEEDLGAELLVNPEKAVKKITDKVRREVEGSMSTQSKAKDNFFAKFTELTEQYPELNNASSDLHVRAKELLASSTDKEWDVNALESSVFRAVTEKGVLPMKHRKVSEDDGADDYLGSGGSGASNTKRPSRNDKLDPKTKAFAELLGMDIKNPKVIEGLTKTQNDRKGNWNRYK